MRRVFFGAFLATAWACIPFAIPVSVAVILYRRWRAPKDGGTVLFVDFRNKGNA